MPLCWSASRSARCASAFRSFFVTYKAPMMAVTNSVSRTGSMSCSSKLFPPSKRFDEPHLPMNGLRIEEAHTITTLLVCLVSTCSHVACIQGHSYICSTWLPIAHTPFSWGYRTTSTAQERVKSSSVARRAQNKNCR